MDPISMGMSLASALMPLVEKSIDLAGKSMDSLGHMMDAKNHEAGKIGEDAHKKPLGQITYNL
ncbi:hypothetical protein [Pseudomonas poae]|uniref:Uncharacterized protein n=1 Tax=Pseudomonas poae TaxID=200451 RepID=A0A2S9EY93_9PSED|nr:hypothetical protein [Pseudomonas poae]PRA29639.1 hypothetical protein CQZ97_11635 [Pseudomonas poae]PRC21961.1 hypothetical protein CQZ99_03975 [Pseudomonas poae]